MKILRDIPGRKHPLSYSSFVLNSTLQPVGFRPRHPNRQAFILTGAVLKNISIPENLDDRIGYRRNKLD
jgi:hypothetical protein